MNGRRDRQRGFALLIVFLMAAAVALMLYQQLPRVAFESEREKEQLLIDRGEQYKRAIQMYVVAYKKYPSKIEDLEDTNNKRYLRRRYIDPMTGKDEWRLVHVNGMGQLTDSLVQKPPALGGKDGALSASGASGASGATGATGADAAPPEVNAMVRQRPSDRTLLPPGGAPPPPANVDPNDPRYWPPISLTTGPTGATGTAAQGVQFPLPQGQIPGQLQGQPGVFPNGAQAGATGQPQVIGPNGQPIPLPSIPGQGINLQTGQIQPLSPGQTGAPANPAVGMINQMLRTPGQQAAPAAANNPFAAGGLVGVASFSTEPSIKVYKDRQKYSEWEFIFDLKQGQPQIPQQPGNPLQPNANPSNTPQPPSPYFSPTPPAKQP